ncbi:MAG: putative molybdenum carrier protein [Thermodesulfobacteriota bacterium]|nr:putative molybdenum carrier protein [Thermodesulfobacteriota bacterium]
MKIISGAQTGADRAGIDAAIEMSITYGGWLPKGRKAEDGKVPEKYTAMQELSRGGYPKRTEQNVIDSDGTVIFTYGKLSTGSALTAKFAKQHKKIYLHINLNDIKDPVQIIQEWIMENDIKVLNVAGRSESKAPGIYDEVKNIIKNVLKTVC